MYLRYYMNHVIKTKITFHLFKPHNTDEPSGYFKRVLMLGMRWFPSFLQLVRHGIVSPETLLLCFVEFSCFFLLLLCFSQLLFCFNQFQLCFFLFPRCVVQLLFFCSVLLVAVIFLSNSPFDLSVPCRSQTQEKFILLLFVTNL